MQQVLNNPSLINYKTTKCYFYDKDGHCKYGAGCQHAHSDKDLKTANEVTMLNSIATAINCQLNNEYLNEYANYPQQENTSEVQMNTYPNYDPNYDPNFTTDTNYGNYDYSQYNQMNPQGNYYYDQNTGQYYLIDPNYQYQNYDYTQYYEQTNQNTQTNIIKETPIKKEFSDKEDINDTTIQKNTSSNKKITIQLDNLKK